MNAWNIPEQAEIAVSKGKITKEMVPLFRDYQSTGRNCLRFFWFCDFSGFICREYITRTDLPMNKIAQNAYADNLHKHHPWILQKAAHYCMNLVNSRDVFDKSLMV